MRRWRQAFSWVGIVVIAALSSLMSGQTTLGHRRAVDGRFLGHLSVVGIQIGMDTRTVRGMLGVPSTIRTWTLAGTCCHEPARHLEVWNYPNDVRVGLQNGRVDAVSGPTLLQDGVVCLTCGDSVASTERALADLTPDRLTLAEQSIGPMPSLTLSDDPWHQLTLRWLRQKDHMANDVSVYGTDSVRSIMVYRPWSIEVYCPKCAAIGSQANRTDH